MDLGDFGCIKSVHKSQQNDIILNLVIIVCIDDVAAHRRQPFVSSWPMPQSGVLQVNLTYLRASSLANVIGNNFPMTPVLLTPKLSLQPLESIP